MAKRTRFRRLVVAHPAGKNTADERGRVRVVVTLNTQAVSGYRVVKGNIVRSVSVPKARVSEVFRVVERALFGR